MSRRRELKALVPKLLDIFDDDRGAGIVALLDSYAALLDENDDLISGHLTIHAADIPDPNIDYYRPDVG